MENIYSITVKEAFGYLEFFISDFNFMISNCIL